MAVKRWLNTRDQFSDSTGAPYSGGKLYFYTAGTTTPEDTFNDSTGAVANANPVILGADGRASGEIWLTESTSYKVVLKTAADVTVWTEDNVDAVNDVTVALSEWVDGPTPTYIGASSFSLTGDQTGTFSVGRRVKIVDSAGTKYGTILTSVFTSLTTITLTAGSDSLASPLTSVQYGIISLSDTSLPVLDEDDMSSDSATQPASQQSIKAYVDTRTQYAIVKATDEEVTSSTALQNDDDFVLAVGANETWAVEIAFSLYSLTLVTCGFKFQFTAPTAATIDGHLYIADETSGVLSREINESVTHSFTFSGGTADAIGGNTILKIVTGANAGNFNFQWAQAVSNANPLIIRAGSVMRYKQLA